MQTLPLILHESANNTIPLEYHNILQTTAKIINNPTRWLYIGIIHDDIIALLNCSQTGIEITRVEVHPNKHKQGIFKAFIENMEKICLKLKVTLSIGCVESSRLKEILKKNKSKWQRSKADICPYSISALSNTDVPMVHKSL